MNKLTDAEVIKALECCGETPKCRECPYSQKCKYLPKDTIDLINRQKAKIENLGEKIVMQMGLITEQKAEIEKLEEMIELSDYSSYSAHLAIKDRQRKNAEYTNELKAEIERLKETPVSQETINSFKADVVKEFAERLKENTTTARFEQGKYSYEIITAQSIDNLVKEMTE